MISEQIAASAQPLGSFAFTLTDFLTPQECQSVIEQAQGQLEKSGLLSDQRDNYRSSSGTWLTRHDLPEVLKKIEKLVMGLTGLPAENQESVQVLHYEVGQEYKDHQDFWHPNTDYYDKQMNRGGQRAWSVLIYLNDVPAGGGTGFPKLGIDVSPQAGKVLAWQNTIDGELNYDSLHAGLPVEEGVKWVAVTWVREQAFR